jgi:putative ABC transport system permease protein
MNELRDAIRTLLRMPVLAAVIVSSLAVGIGVNTTVFSWIQAVVLEPLPGVGGASRLLFIEPRATTGSYPGSSWLEYQDLKERVPSLIDPLAFRMVPLAVGEPGRTERAHAQLVSGNYFDSLRLTPAIGRFIRRNEALRPGGEPVAVISYDYWRNHFAAAPDVVGRTIRANDAVLTIIGVAPARFQGTVLGLSFDMWVPATLAPVLVAGSRELEDRSQRGYAVLTALAPGATRAQAQAEVDRAMLELARTYPETNANVPAELLPFWMAPRGPQRMLAGALLILQAVMLLLLLAVCGNTANLMLARASARQREIGVRLALGAGPMRVIRLLLTESLLLALAGAAIGALLARWGTTALRAAPMISAFPIRFQTAVDGTGLVFATLLGGVCGVIFGLAPALQLARVDPQAAMRSGARSAGRSGFRNALMGVQVALALVVLMAAALFVRSFAETREIDPGFRREGVLLAAYDLSGRGADAAAARTFAARLLRELRALPTVESAAIAASVPLDIHGLPLRSFTLEGRASSQAAPDQALSNAVTPGYFSAMGIGFVAGSDFVDLDDVKAPAQAIVNEEFVRRFVGSGAFLGRRISTRGGDYTIIGLVRNSLSESFDEPPTPVIYLSYRDRPARAGEIHVRTRVGTETLLAPDVQRIVRTLDPGLPLYDVRTLGEHVEKNLFLRRIPARMFVVLGPMLLILAAIGIYAVVDFTVSRRTTEIGVRLALGATQPRVVRQIVGESLRVIGAGALVGWTVMVLVALHLLRGVLQVSVFGAVPALLMFVAFIACWVPAHRATRLDPLAALRQE